MIKLFATIKDNYLKLRPARSGEIQTNPFLWENELSIEFTTETNFMMYWTSLLPDLDPPEAKALVDLVSARYPLADEYLELQQKCPDLIFNDPNPEWVFYGGSFNPWHQGHQNCLNLLPPNKTCIITPDINPQKENPSFELIPKILNISSKCRLRDHQFLCPTFLNQNKKNPTINWVKKMKQLNPEKSISLLMGFDSFYNLHTWFQYEDLLKNLKAIYIVSRMENEQMQLEANQKIQMINPNLELIFLGRHSDEDMSSTKLRDKK